MYMYIDFKDETLWRYQENLLNMLRENQYFV